MKKTSFAILVLASSFVNAEPSSSVLYLMNEPVTLFDRGLKDLGKKVDKSLRLEDFPELTKQLNAGASYDWNANRIKINGTAYQDGETLGISDSGELCKRIMHRVKFNLGYAEETAYFREIGASGIAPYFRHYGFSSIREPEGLEDDLAGITKLYISIMASEDNSVPFSRRSTCFSDLAGSKIYISGE